MMPNFLVKHVSNKIDIDVPVQNMASKTGSPLSFAKVAIGTKSTHYKWRQTCPFSDRKLLFIVELEKENSSFMGCQSGFICSAWETIECGHVYGLPACF